MERPVIKDIEEFSNMCEPIVNYLRENCNPYVEVHISTERISVTSVECGIPLNNNDD